MNILKRDASVWPYLSLAYGISWGAWIPAALSGQDVNTFPVVVLLLLGGVGPMLASLALTYRNRDRNSHLDFWRRVIGFKRIGVKWYAVIFLTMPILTVAAMLLDMLRGGQGGDWETAVFTLSHPLTLLSVAAFNFFFGPLPEELGWRGYALDRLQARHNALVSSLLLGIAWSLWHLPLFFIKGTYQHGLGIGSLHLWLFMFDLVPKSVLYTWICNNNRRSTLSAILFHFMTNFTGELLKPSARSALYQVVLLTGLAIIVAIVWRPKMLTHQQKREPLHGRHAQCH